MKRDEYQTRMDQMHSSDADVVGYVTTNYRDSRDTTVQGEHRFTVDLATSVVTTNETGWWDGFGPIQVRPGTNESTVPAGLAIRDDYFWIPISQTTGKFASSKTNAIGGVGIELSSAGGPTLVMGLSRTLANIENVFFEIDQYYERYTGIDGIFLDEMNDMAQADDVEYYQRIFNYIKAKSGKALVVENPGKTVSALMLGYADVFLTFEGRHSDYAGHDSRLEMNHPAGKFWHAIHACPAGDMPGTVAASRMNNAGYIYVTDRGDANPWEHIASYFHDEKYEVQYRNSPPAVIVR